MLVVSHLRYIVFQAPCVSTLMWNGRLGIGTSRLQRVPARDSIDFRTTAPIKPRGTMFPWFDSMVTKDGWNMLIVPLWLPLAGMTLLTIVLFIHSRVRWIDGLCGKCSYDLTGNVSGVCPECGTAIPVRPTKDG